MTTPPNPNDLLMGSGAKSASFNGSPPITCTGRIVSVPQVQQQTNLQGDPLTFPDGKPRWQLVVQVQTDQRDPADASDDGVRALYIKANSQKAVAEAVRKVGRDGLEVGGTLSLTYTGDDNSKPPRPGFNQPKLYTATYQPPNDSGQFLGTAPAAQPAAPTPAATDRSPEAYLKARGVDPATFGPGADLASIVALMQQTGAQPVG